MPDVKEVKQQAAADLVERARAGDQVAMSVLVMVREQSSAGNAQARQAFKFLERYIKTHPPSQTPGAGGIHGDVSGTTKTPVRQLWVRIVALANGSDLSVMGGDLQTIDEAVEDPDANAAYRWAVGHWQEPRPENADKSAWGLGRMVGIARAIQAIRQDNTPLGVLCPVVAWELE